MPSAPRSPLDDTDRLVVDGSNLIHRLSGPVAPPSTIVGRLRAAVPVTVSIELVFDGVGHGITGRLAQNMHVRYSGRRTGDETILELVGDGASSPLVAARTLVVTDDRDLRTALAVRGTRTAGTAWLLARMDVPAAAPAQGRRRTSIGAGRPPAGARAWGADNGSGGPGGTDDADGRPGWKPGRGATSKTGTPHKVARHRRHPRHP
jgi:rRNA-processing protein FCF1